MGAGAAPRTRIARTSTGTRGARAASFAWINATAKTDQEDYHLLNVRGADAIPSKAGSPLR